MKRQISESEKQILLNQYRRPDGKIYCFVDNEPIDDEKSIQFDHIDPFIKSDDTSLDNIAPVCKTHNLAKKDMSLSEYRDKLSIEKLFKSKEDNGKQLKLNDVLESKFNSEYGFIVKYDYDPTNEIITLKYFSDKNQTKLYISPQKNRAVKNKSYFYNCYGKEKEYYIENQG